MIKKIHKEIMSITLEAKGRGAFDFGHYNEKRLFNKDLLEIVHFCRDKISKQELDSILEDVRCLRRFII